jgi:hypothetical protein
MGISRRNFLKILTAAGTATATATASAHAWQSRAPSDPVRLPRGPDPLHRLSQVRTSLR